MSAASDVTVVPADGGKTFREFLRLPYDVYAGDPNWVAPLLRDSKTLFDRARHPFHRHSEVQPFVAMRGNRCVGRIAAIHNHNHIAFHDEPVGFFGFFECRDDQDAADALFEAAGEWLRARDLKIMRGPASFSTNETAGLLIEGFERPPVVMMPYNPAYYVPLIERSGFETAVSMVSYYLDNDIPPEYLVRREERLAKRLDVTVRTLRKEDFDDELERVRYVYNRAWEQNWGFVPMTDAEIRFMARELKPLVLRDPEQVIIVESKGEPVGFALWLKDVNRALIHARGRLFPFGLLKILWHMRKITFLRVLTLGLVPEYRHLGIDSLLYLRIFREGSGKGIREGEFGWVLEDNHAMRKPLEKIGSRVYKRFRMYDRAL